MLPQRSSRADQPGGTTVVASYSSTISGPDRATDFTLAYNNKLDRSGQLRRLQTSLPLLNPAGSHPGMMNEETWKTAYRILVEQGGLKAPVDLNTAYTTAFLDKVYNSQAATP